MRTTFLSLLLISLPSLASTPLLSLEALLDDTATPEEVAAPTALSLHPPHHGYTHLIMKSGANSRLLITDY